MEILESIRQDLKNSLSFSDEPRVLQSIMLHLEDQCSEAEQVFIENRMMDIPAKEYECYEEFIADYQPIFDSVDFPIKDCVMHYDKLKFSQEKLDRYLSDEKGNDENELGTSWQD